MIKPIILILLVFSLSLFAVNISSAYAVTCVQWTNTFEPCYDYVSGEYMCNTRDTCWNSVCWIVDTSSGCDSCGPSGECITQPKPTCTSNSWCSSKNSCQRYNIYSDCSDGYTTDNSCTSLCTSPPSNTCVNANTLRTYSSAGTCSAGSCSYSSTDTACTYGCSGGSCNSPPSTVCGNNEVESGESCEGSQTFTSTTGSTCGSEDCIGTQSYVYNCISSTCQWDSGSWTACSTQGTSYDTPKYGSCSVTACGQSGTQSVTSYVCDSTGSPKDTVSSQSCTGTSCTYSGQSCLNNACTPKAGDSCDDKNACTTGDKYEVIGGVGGDSLICQGSALCNDNNPCTTDSCEPSTGCKYTNVADNTLCTSQNTNGVCKLGNCMIPTPTPAPVSTPSLFPTCTKGSISTTENSWSIKSDCWGTPQTSCKDGLDGCSLDCNFGQGYVSTLLNVDDMIIPKGKWKLTAVMSNIDFSEKCHAGVIPCLIGESDCRADVLDTVLAIALDGSAVADRTEYSSTSAESKTEATNTESVKPITLTADVDCAKDQGCLLNIRRYLSYQGWAHYLSVFGLGGDGDYHYGQVTADVSVTWQKIETIQPISTQPVSTCGTCTSPNELGTLSDYGELTATTCSLSPDKDDVIKFTVNKAGYVIATLTSSTPGFYVSQAASKGTDYCSPSISCNTVATTSSTPTASCNFKATSTGEYAIRPVKTSTSTGSGTAGISVKLGECLQNSDCTAAYGAGYVCDVSTNKCKVGACDPAKNKFLPDQTTKVNEDCFNSDTQLLGVCKDNGDCEFPYTTCSYNAACRKDYCCGSTSAGGPGGTYTNKCLGPNSPAGHIPSGYTSYLCTK